MKSFSWQMEKNESKIMKEEKITYKNMYTIITKATTKKCCKFSIPLHGCVILLISVRITPRFYLRIQTKTTQINNVNCLREKKTTVNIKDTAMMKI